MNDFTPVIGLEIHVELSTRSKMFCQCLADFFGKKPNSQVCPVCLGLPGALPVPNKKAIEWTIKIGKALNCKINEESKFDRKHYFYPDLPKGYQISQYDEPIAKQGWLEIRNSKFEIRKYRITRVHLEEDTGKLIHQEKESLVDFNRSGVPLVEIVTEPDFDNVNDVVVFLKELHTIIKEYLQVSDANMEQGSMRLEPNISIAVIPTPYQVRDKLQRESSSGSTIKVGDDNWPKYKVEVKNINSFRFVKKAIDFEIERQVTLLKQGKKPVQETRGYDEKKGITVSQRVKEEAQDYRYFPEPDIPPLSFTQKDRDEVAVPELPSEKMYRYIDRLKVKETDAFTLSRSAKLGDYFEELVTKSEENPQNVANLLVNKKINQKESIEKNAKLIKQLQRPQETDTRKLSEKIDKILQEQTREVQSYKSGKENVMMFFVGRVMKEMRGQADPQVVKKELEKKLKET